MEVLGDWRFKTCLAVSDALMKPVHHLFGVTLERHGEDKPTNLANLVCCKGNEILNELLARTRPQFWTDILQDVPTPVDRKRLGGAIVKKTIHLAAAYAQSPSTASTRVRCDTYGLDGIMRVLLVLVVHGWRHRC